MKLQALSLTSYHQILDVSRSSSFTHSSTQRPTTTPSRFLLQRHQCYHQPQPSRRNLLIGGGSSSLPLLISTYFQTTTTTDAQAAAEVEESKEIITFNEKNCENQVTAEKVYFDVSIDREPIGRIIVGLYGENSTTTTTTVGAARFASLVSGKAGVSYRRKDFVKIMPNYIQHGGIRSFGMDTELTKQSGQADLIADELLSEWEMNNNDKNKNCSGSNSTRNVAGSVGIIVRNPSKPAPKLKLVAKKGKLVIDEEEIGVDPNGTEFVIATKDSPELDASTLVVGRVLHGMDVVEMISKVQTVQENKASPYFKVAKLIGDKRAVVAERGFNRPYSKVMITNCGIIN